MFDETVKSAYQSIVPPEDMKGRVMTACRAAKKQRIRRQKQLASAAACFAVVLCMALYGFMPMPGLSSGVHTLEDGVLPVTFETAMGPESVQTWSSATVMTPSARVASAGDPVENCIPLRLDRKATVTVSAGELYVMNGVSGISEPAGQKWTAEDAAQIYWQCNEEDASLQISAGLRKMTLTLVEEDGRWSLVR